MNAFQHIPSARPFLLSGVVLSLMLLGLPAAHAQPCGGLTPCLVGQHVDPTISGNTFEVSLQLRLEGGNGTNNGGLTHIILFDAAALNFDSATFFRFDGNDPSGCYNGSFANSPLDGQINLNLVYDFINCDFGGGSAFPASFETLVTFHFTIEDPSQTTNLIPGTVVAQDSDGNRIEVDFSGIDSLLPVELTGLKAQADGAAVLLTWTTASETNNAGFEIQRISKNVRATGRSPQEWQTLVFVEGHGTTLEPQAYRYRVEALAPGRHVFRLKQVDFDGTFEYSPEVETIIGVSGTHALSHAYPNPFRSQAQFTLAVSHTQHVRVMLYDALGRRVRVLHDGVLQENTTHPFVIDGRGLPSGFYVYGAEGETFRDDGRIMLVK